MRTATRQDREAGRNGSGGRGVAVARVPRAVLPRISPLAARRLQAEHRVAASTDRHEREAEQVATALVPQAHPARWHGDAGRAAPATPATLDRVGAAVRRPGQGRPLPSGTRSWFELRLGRPLAHVRLHDGADAHAATAALGARAMTYGNHVWLGPGIDDRPNRVLAHELVHTVQQTGTPPLAPGAPAIGAVGPGIQRAVDPELDVLLVGHASSRWDAPGVSTREQRNLDLAAARVATVEPLFRAVFNRKYGHRGDPSFVFERISVEAGADHLGPATTAAEGSTRADAVGGDLRADDPAWRRVDINVRPRLHVTGVARSTQAGTVTDETRTRRWSVKILMVLSAGEGGGGAVALGRMRNRRTGQEASGGFAGAGLAGGVELPIPAVAPFASWSDFSLQQPQSFEDLDGSPARLTDLSLGVGVAGYSAAYFYVSGMPRSVYVGGFVMNEWGVGGAVVGGIWSFDRIPRAPQREVAQTVEAPYAFTLTDEFEHRVHFATGSAVVDAANLAQLEVYADTIIAHILAAEAAHAD
jgi:hypothetical protein